MLEFFKKNNLVCIAAGALFLSMSTRMLYSHLALYLKVELHDSTSKIALMDGSIEFLSYLVRVFFGLVSDYFHARRVWIVSGCAVVLLVKPLFIFLSNVWEVLLAAVMIDRFGTGMQVCPRDALVAECSTKNRYCAVFGFLKTMKTIGYATGVLLAVGIMYFSGGNYCTLFFCSAVPALLSLLAALAIKSEPNTAALQYSRQLDNAGALGQRIIFFLKSLRYFGCRFFFTIIIAGICRMGFFGESLLILRANDFTSGTYAAITVLFVGLGQAIFAYPMGLLADKICKIHVIIISLVVSVFANAFMMSCDNIYALCGGIFFSSGQQAVIQTLFLAIINGSVKDDLRATAIGMFYCTMGLAYFVGTGICGIVCEHHGPAIAFLCCIVINLCGFLLCFLIKLWPEKYSDQR
ncbi:MAG: MFS transporter [Holosporaceae bacterium]|jgi:MFS family permease|nr:MFS transporter [Holosporaceae bacterium]